MGSNKRTVTDAKIIEMFCNHLSYSEIARTTGVSRQLVSRVCKKHIEGNSSVTVGNISIPSEDAIRSAVNEAVRCRETSKESCIVCTLSGHGLCELASWSVDRNCTPQRSCTQEEFPHGR